MRSSAPLRHPARHLLACAIALCLLPTVAPAQQAASPVDQDRHDASATDLDHIIVRANPLRSTAEQVSKPVEVLAGEALDAAKSTTLGDTVAKLPGVQSSNFGAGVGRPVIRGMDGPRVSTLSDGLSSGDVSSVSQDHGVSIEPFLADQIEVLKGPSTLLYGSGAIGGAVNLVDGRIAERPLTQTLTGRAELRGSSADDGRVAMGRIDAMGADGALVLHADGLLRDLKDYATPLGRQTNSFVRTRTGALAASLVGEHGFLGASVSRYHDRYGNPGEPGDAAAGEAPVHLDMEQSRYEVKAGRDTAFGPFDGMRVSLAATDYAHTEFEGEEVGTRFKSRSNEGRLQFTHRQSDAWRGALGVQLGNRVFEAIGEEAFVPRTRTTTSGVFVVQQYRKEPLQIDVGARVDRVAVRPNGYAARSFTPVSLSASGLWTLPQGWRLSLNLDRAERAPAEEELFARGPHAATGSYEIGLPTLRREQANQIEAGLHHHGEHFDAKLSAYYNRFNGFIYLRDTGAVEDQLPVREWTQGNATFRGVEGEIVAHALASDAGNLDIRVFGDMVRATLRTGEPLPRIVPARLGAELLWKADAWRASLGATRVAAQERVAGGETPTAGYTFVDAHVAWHRDWTAGGVELFVDGNNLTNRVGRVHTSFLKDNVVLPGRTISAGIRVFF